MFKPLFAALKRTRTLLLLLLFVLGFISLAAYTRLPVHAQGQSKAAPSVQEKGSSASKQNPVPAYVKEEAGLKRLPETLLVKQMLELVPDAPPQVVRAYEVARLIPKILAQLPCYCYCDESGHESLLSCYVDDHAAHCQVCAREALLAYNWQKKLGLNAAQIRDRIIATRGRGEEHKH
ncbi:MAG TPA: CYCXC family (seleno)protein [Pyrinomonadaceae bacterium]|jgi:hypothetical protein